MLLRLSPLLRRVLIAWACVLWTAGATSAQLHDVLFTHVVCLEHGVVEHGAEHAADSDSDSDSDASDDGPSIRSADQSSHGDACPMDVVPTSGAVVSSSAPALAYFFGFAEPIIALYSAAPRGPPLAYAPKTSPPFHA